FQGATCGLVCPPATIPIRVIQLIQLLVFPCNPVDCSCQWIAWLQSPQRHYHTILQIQGPPHHGIYLSSPTLLVVQWCCNWHTSSPFHFQQPVASVTG